MNQKINNILKTATFRQSTLTMSATVVNGLLGIAFYALLARFLGAENFGVVSIAIVTITLLSDMANVGTDTGIVRFVGQHIGSDKVRALKYLKFGLEIKLLVGLVVVVVGWFLMPIIAREFLSKPDLTIYLRLALFGSATALLYSFSSSALQSVQKYTAWSLVQISSNTTRLLLTGVLFFLGALSITSSLLLYIVVPLLAFIVSLLILPKFLNAKKETTIAKEFLHYNKWIALFAIIAAVSSRLDTYLTTHLLSFTEVGFYSVALNLAGVVPQIVFAIGAVVAPKLASFTTKSDFLRYFKKLQLFLFSLTFFGVVFGIFFGTWFIPTLYGGEYLASITPFIILLVAQGVFLISVPVHTAVIYYYAKPQVFIVTSLVHLVIIFLAGTVLIGHFGIAGASWAVLLGNIFNLLLPALWLFFKLQND